MKITSKTSRKITKMEKIIKELGYAIRLTSEYLQIIEKTLKRYDVDVKEVK